MTWHKTRADRKADDAFYGSAEYKLNKAIVRRRSGGRCEVEEGGRRCGSTDRAEVDHIIPRSRGGTHKLSNLQMLCHGHHHAKTATEGGGWRRPRSSSDPQPRPRTQW